MENKYITDNTDKFIEKKRNEVRAIIKNYAYDESLHGEAITKITKHIQDAIKYGERRERERMKGIFNLMADTMGVIDIPKLTNSKEGK